MGNGIMFGGFSGGHLLTYPGETQECVDGLEFDWIKINNGTSSGRSGHTSIVCMDKAFTFGGLSGDGQVGNGEATGRLSVYDPELDGWLDHSTTGTIPGPRTSYAMCSNGRDTLFLIGGIDTTRRLTAHMHTLNINAMEWTHHQFDEAVGKTALSLYGQSLSYFRNSLCVFGGHNGLGYCQETFKYDIDSATWTLLSTLGNIPSPRNRHGAFVEICEGDEGDQLYVIGGGAFYPKTPKLDAHVLNLQSLEWKRVTASGTLPLSRFAFASCYDGTNNKYYIFGGLTNSLEVMNDLHCFEVRSKCWAQIRTECSPRARAFHSSFFLRRTLYVFGGTDGNYRYDYTWRLEPIKDNEG